jgi:hypothetical protein
VARPLQWLVRAASTVSVYRRLAFTFCEHFLHCCTDEVAVYAGEALLWPESLEHHVTPTQRSFHCPTARTAPGWFSSLTLTSSGSRPRAPSYTAGFRPRAKLVATSTQILQHEKTSIGQFGLSDKMYEVGEEYI